jgi:hypothetical protein
MSTFYVPLEEATKAEIIDAIRTGYLYSKREVERIEDRIYELRGDAAQKKADEALAALTAHTKRETSSLTTEQKLKGHVEWLKLAEACEAAERECEKYNFSPEKTPKKYQRK